MEKMTAKKEVVMYEHRCGMCGRYWASPEKADTCPACGHWHINFYGSSFLETKDVRAR